MSNTIAPVPPVERGDCLACSKRTPLEPRGTAPKVVSRHLTEHEQPGAEAYGDSRWVCNGSSHPPAHGDQFDVTRTYAVARHALARQAATKLRREMAEALADRPHWQAGSVVTHYAAATALQEALACFWRDLAAACDPLTVVGAALGSTVRSDAPGSLVERAMLDARAAAARQFVTEVRRELERVYPDGWTADQIYTALFSI